MVHRHIVTNGTIATTLTTTTTTTTTSTTTPNKRDLVAVPTSDSFDNENNDNVAPYRRHNNDPHHATENVGGTISAAIFGIIKGMVGPAVLYTPRAFADAGYVFALCALSASTALFLYSSQRLLDSWKHVVVQQHEQQEQQQESKDSSCSCVNDEIELVSLSKGLEESRRHIVVDSHDDDDENDNDENDDNHCQVDGIHRHTTNNNNYTTNTTTTRTRTINSAVTYPQLAHLAFGQVGEAAVRTGICLMQLGICLTYFIFVPHNLTASLDKLLGLHVPLWWNLILMVLVEIPLCWIRDIRKLVYTNVAANALISFGLACCLYLALFVANDNTTTTTETTITPDNASHQGNFTWTSPTTTTTTTPNLSEGTTPTTGSSYLSPWNDQWYLFIGTSVLLFEGSITLCLPLQAALNVPEAETKFPAVYKQTITGIVIFYCFFAMICWTAFGSDVNTVLTVSLPSGVWTTLVQLCYSIAVIFTFPFQIFPASEIVVHLVQKYRHRNLPQQQDRPLALWQRRALIVALLIVLAIIAVLEMNNLGRVVSLMGSLLGCPLAFSFPPLIHNCVVPSAPRTLNNAVAGLGLVAMVGATLITLATWSEG